MNFQFARSALSFDRKITPVLSLMSTLALLCGRREGSKR